MDEFIFKCQWNSIHLIFPPPHTSSVLQPLDIGIFEPMKQAQSSAISELNSCNNTTLEGPSVLLQCYSKARLAGITKENIRAGWKAAGLWSVNVSIPLQNPIAHTLPERLPPKQNLEKSEVTLSIPKSSKQLRRLVSSVFPKLTSEQQQFPEIQASIWTNAVSQWRL